MKLITAVALLACAASSANAAEMSEMSLKMGQQNTGSNPKTDANGSDLKQSYTSVVSSHPKVASWANAATNAITSVGKSIKTGMKNGKTSYDNAKLQHETDAQARSDYMTGFSGKETEVAAGSCQIHVEGHAAQDFCVKDLSEEDCTNFAQTCQFSAAVSEFHSTETQANS